MYSLIGFSVEESLISAQLDFLECFCDIRVFIHNVYDVCLKMNEIHNLKLAEIVDKPSCKHFEADSKACAEYSYIMM